MTIWPSREELKTNWTEQHFNSLSTWSHPCCLPHNCNRKGPRDCISTYPKKLGLFVCFFCGEEMNLHPELIWLNMHRIWLNMTAEVPFYKYWLWNLPQLWFHFSWRKAVQCTTENTKENDMKNGKSISVPLHISCTRSQCLEQFSKRI